MKLTQGQLVRCRNLENDLVGKVLLASDTDPQSVAVGFGDIAGIRMNGSLVVANMLPLMIDYKAEIATDLWGNEWEIDVKEEKPKL